MGPSTHDVSIPARLQILGIHPNAAQNLLAVLSEIRRAQRRGGYGTTVECNRTRNHRYVGTVGNLDREQVVIGLGLWICRQFLDVLNQLPRRVPAVKLRTPLGEALTLERAHKLCDERIALLDTVFKINEARITQQVLAL